MAKPRADSVWFAHDDRSSDAVICGGATRRPRSLERRASSPSCRSTMPPPSPRRSPRARAAQPAWAALGAARRARRCCAGRAGAGARRAAAIFELLERETGKARFDVVGELMGVCLDLGGLARRAPRWLQPRARQHAAAVRQARLRRLPAARRRRHHQPVERAAQSGARRRGAGAAGRQRGDHQAVGAGAAGGAARLRGDEPRAAGGRAAGGDRRRRRPARRWSTTST